MEHTHIKLKNGGHVTWIGKTPPSEKQIETFESLAEKVRDNFKKNED